MKILPISERLLPKNVKQDLHNVLKEMDKRRACDVKKYKNYNEFHSKWIGWIGLKDEKGDVFAKFKDCGLYSDCYAGDMPVNSQIEYKDRVYRISNKTGTFHTNKKGYESIVEPLQESVKNISKILKQIKENFDNPDVVKKEWYSMRGLMNIET